MAEKPYNDTHPKLRQAKSSQKKKSIHAHNVIKYESMPFVQRNAPNTENRKQNKTRKKKIAVVNATVGAGSSGAVIPQEAVQARPADNDASTPSAVILDPLQKCMLEQNYMCLLDKVSYT
jgi:predicted glycosyltransferase